MKRNQNLLFRKYDALKAKYIKLKQRYQQKVEQGKLPFKHQHAIVKRLARYRRKLQQLMASLKAGLQTGVLASALTATVFTATFTSCNNDDEPSPTAWYEDADGDGFGNPDVTQTATSQPTGFVADNTDCDDSNADINPGMTEIAGNGIDNNCDGNLAILDLATREFTSVASASNPFGSNTFGMYEYTVRPAFVDIDGDGDLDAFLAKLSGNIDYYENTGSSTSPAFTERTGDSNPFNGVDVGVRAVIAFTDIDGDGDYDAFIGEGSTVSLNYYRNDGSSTNPSFAAVTGAANPLAGLADDDTHPIFADIDGDGDQDAIIGYDAGSEGQFYYYQNNNGTFTQQTGNNNPFNAITTPTDSYAGMSLGDIDGDGDLDLIVLEYSNNFALYENTGSATSPTFTLVTGNRDMTAGLSFASSNQYYPVLVDIDADGDLDLFVGGYTSSYPYNATIYYFQNNAQ